MTIADTQADDPESDDKEPAGTAYERLASEIQRQILSGELKAGDQLPTETELSNSYQVGRNTAREAIRALASRSLVQVKRGVGGGTFVTMPSPEQVKSSLLTNLALLSMSSDVSASALIEIRESLEVPAAEAAAFRSTPEDRSAIRHSLQRGAEGGRTHFACSREFHMLLAASAHNALLNIFIVPIFQVLEERFGHQRVAQFWVQNQRDHEEIFSYLEAGDQAGTREATRMHLRSVRHTYEEIERERNS